MTEPNRNRLMRQGLLHERQRDLKALEHRVAGIIGSLQEAVFLFDRHDPWVIDGAKVRNHARELDDVLRQGRSIRETIDDLQSELGEQD